MGFLELLEKLKFSRLSSFYRINTKYLCGVLYDWVCRGPRFLYISQE